MNEKQVISRVVREYVQIGHGRLGQLIADSVKQRGLVSKVNFARISESIGLCDLQGNVLSGIVEKLVICISPSSNSQWQWSEILQGVEKQVNENKLVIHQLVFVSSTRVYDGIDAGIITASTVAIAKSQAGLNLLKAEEQVKKLATNAHILRCSGLYSENHKVYQKYFQILFSDSTKARFGVDVEQVVHKVVALITQKKIQGCFYQYCLLTDGNCYINAEKLKLTEPKVALLSKRLLKMSDDIVYLNSEE